MPETRKRPQTSTGGSQNGSNDAPARPWDGLPKAEAQVVRDEFCLTLRQAGYSLPRIAVEAGYADHTGARTAVRRALANQGAERKDELRQMLMGRLERLLQSRWGLAMQGDPSAAEFCRKVIMDQATMSGVNAPMKLEVFGNDAIAEEIERLERRIAERKANALEAKGSVKRKGNGSR